MPLLGEIFAFLEEIQPRWYSVASSPKIVADQLRVKFSKRRSKCVQVALQVDLAVSLLQVKLHDGRVRKGFCSGYLVTARIGSQMTCVHK